MLFNQSSGRPPYLGHAHGEDILQVSLHKMFSLFAVLVGKRHREMPVCQADCLIRGINLISRKKKKILTAYREQHGGKVKNEHKGGTPNASASASPTSRLSPAAPGFCFLDAVGALFYGDTD